MTSKTVNPNAETWEECVRLREEAAKQDRALEEVMTERDRAEAYADQLAQCIAEMTGAEIGEHSNLNCPWEEAIEACAQFITEKRSARETSDPSADINSVEYQRGHAAGYAAALERRAVETPVRYPACIICGTPLPAERIENYCLRPECGLQAIDLARASENGNEQ